MEPLLVSVVIPTYNRSHLLCRAVESALSQCREGDEVIVVDDGSTDDTARAMARFAHPVRYLRAPHGGAGKARNFGAAQARNPLVAFLDSDDEWMPGKLDRQRSIMQARPDVAFCFSDFRVRAGGRDYPRYLRNWHQDPRSWHQILKERVRYSALGPAGQPGEDFWVYIGDLYPALLERLYVLTSSMMARKATAGSALFFEEDLPTLEDWGCFGRLARTGPAAYLDVETAWQHGHAGPRLTSCDVLEWTHARLAILERVWRADSAFLERNAATYRRVADGVRLTRIKRLLMLGRKQEALHCFEQMASPPWYLRPLLALPAGVASWPRQAYLRVRAAMITFLIVVFCALVAQTPRPVLSRPGLPRLRRHSEEHLTSQLGECPGAVLFSDFGLLTIAGGAGRKGVSGCVALSAT